MYYNKQREQAILEQMPATTNSEFDKREDLVK